MQDSRAATGEACGVLAALDSHASRLYSDQANIGQLHEATEDSDGVAAAADAGEHRIRW